MAVIEGGNFYEFDNGNLSQVPAYAVLYTALDPSNVQSLVDWGIFTVPQVVRIPFLNLLTDRAIFASSFSPR